DRRLRMIQMIGALPDAHKAASKLLTLLDDPNTQVRTAALTALSTSAPPQALPKLRKMLDDLHPQEAIRTVLATLGKMGTPKAKEALVTFLEAGLEDGRRAAYLYDALGAFETATGQRWRQAGAYSLENYRQQARAALKWWRQQ
ncbi:MAG: HEAT repeat domain-containing protein, partial [Gemmataceae bacterium]|nr:HEAT repeat domain-containing protein [Gemmataceae bacterium]